MHTSTRFLLTFSLALLPVAASAQSMVRSARMMPTGMTSVHSPRRASMMQMQQNDARSDRRVRMAKKPVAYAPKGDIIPALSKNGFSMGEVASPVTIVEFIDYECQHCATFHHETFPILKKRYIDAGVVRFAVRQFPLETHAYAIPAALAVECARTQSDDMAWGVHDAILNALYYGRDFTADDRLSILQTVQGLIVPDVTACMQSRQKIDAITQDVQDGIAGGVNGTPSFWILGRRGKSELIQGNQPFDIFKKAIESHK